ncbi:hypothetical protein [Microvirus mar12]|uniref:Internal scaffolding protein n=1 Tax=Microvirus mar12 TaxID=2851144 RepID=A0A8F5RCN9_9VIRU|nr:hypothetical protein [Microvirus mar12]
MTMSLRDKLLHAPIRGVKFETKLPKFGYTFDEKTGERVFKQIGLVDQQANIDSELESCDYSVLMQSLTTSMRDFDFDDFLDDLPTFDKNDPMQLIAARENLQIAYQNLPKEVKATYENNSRKFADSIVGGQFGDLFASWKPDQQADKDNNKGNLDDLAARVEQLTADLAGMRSDGGKPVEPTPTDNKIDQGGETK